MSKRTMSEDERRFVAALRAVVGDARDRGMHAGFISGALVALAADETTRALSLPPALSHDLASAAMEAMRDVAGRTEAS